MYGYGYGYNFARPSGVSFHPLDLAGTQLYFAKNTATPSLWNDQSPNGYDLTQSTATQQPTISANSVDFDGINDGMVNGIIDVFSADTNGVIYFSFNYILGETQNLLISADPLTNNNSFRLLAFSNKMYIAVRINLSYNNFVESVNNLVSGYNYGYIGSTGTSYFMNLNGVITTFTTTEGDDGAWWSSVPNRKNLSIAEWLRLSPSGRYTPSKVNKIYYNNTVLSASNLTKLNTFFSDPNNY